MDEYYGNGGDYLEGLGDDVVISLGMDWLVVDSLESAPEEVPEATAMHIPAPR